MVGYVINRWCNTNKGSIMGAVLCANGIGIAIGAAGVNLAFDVFGSYTPHSVCHCRSVLRRAAHVYDHSAHGG